MSARPAVRVYGLGQTNSSFGRVAAGLCEGLRELDALAGFVPLDRLDQSDDLPLTGADAPIALFTGPPSMVAAMTSYGAHEHCFAVLAPNSDWLPRDLVDKMRQYCVLVAPSSWGAEVLARYTRLPLPPLRHGVSAAFRPSEADVRPAPKQAFRVLHLASTYRQRKGTRELIRCWSRVRAKLGDNPFLHLIVDAPPGVFAEVEQPGTGVQLIARRLDAPAAQMSELLHHYHVVCQPSRAEGFGLTVVETRASGVPIIATGCTGHADQIQNGDMGVLVVAHGADGPVDDAPEGELSQAPTIVESELEAALVEAYERYSALDQQARAVANDVRAEWSWANQTERWLKEMQLWT